MEGIEYNTVLKMNYERLAMAIVKSSLRDYKNGVKYNIPELREESKQFRPPNTVFQWCASMLGIRLEVLTKAICRAREVISRSGMIDNKARVEDVQKRYRSGKTI